MIEQKQTILDSGSSYLVGGGVFALANLADLATLAQQIGMILGAALVVVKLVYDLMKLKRDFFSKK